MSLNVVLPPTLRRSATGLAFGAAAVVLLLSASASATLIEVDLPGGGTNEATLDDTTGLLWLDLTVTDGRSFSNWSAVAPAAATGYNAWRVATGAEFCALTAAYGVDPTCAGFPLSGSGSTTIGSPNASLVSLFGATNGSRFSNGLLSDGDGDSLVGEGTIEVRACPGCNSTTALVANAWSPATTSNARGVFVVAAVVPEPSTGLLLSAGLAALAAFGRQR